MTAATVASMAARSAKASVLRVFISVMVVFLFRCMPGVKVSASRTWVRAATSQDCGKREVM